MTVCLGGRQWACPSWPTISPISIPCSGDCAFYPCQEGWHDPIASLPCNWVPRFAVHHLLPHHGDLTHQGHLLISSSPSWPRWPALTWLRKCPRKWLSSSSRTWDYRYKKIKYYHHASMLSYRVLLFTGPPQFQYQKENCQAANQAFLSNRIYWNSSCDWLIGNFLFGTEIGEGQLKKSPCMIMIMITWGDGEEDWCGDW